MGSYDVFQFVRAAFVDVIRHLVAAVAFAAVDKHEVVVRLQQDAVALTDVEKVYRQLCVCLIACLRLDSFLAARGDR